MAAPTPIAVGRDRTTSGGSSFRKNKRPAEKSSTRPINVFKIERAIADNLQNRRPERPAAQMAKKFPGEMARAPELIGADRSDQNIQNERRWPDFRRTETP